VKVYVIGKFERKFEVRQIIKDLEEAGHVITEDWTEGEDATHLMGTERIACLRRSAEADKRGVQEAEAVIILHHDQLCGGLVEAGMAIGAGKLVLVISEAKPTARRQPIFYWLPEVRFFESREGAVSFLNECEKSGWK